MKIYVIHPDKKLSFYVKNICTLEHNSSDDTFLPFFADGCPGIIYQQTQSGMYMQNEQKRLSALFVYGQTIKPIILQAKGNFRMIVFYLYPHVLKSMLGINAKELTDACIEMDLLSVTSCSSLIDQLQSTSQTEQQTRYIMNYLFELIQKNNPQTDRIIQTAINHILNSKGQISIKTLREQLYTTERTFERRFEQHVGITAKLFARICQFKASLNQLHEKDYGRLSDVAFDNGYVDQSHFIRSFREFSGYSPLEFQKQPDILNV